MAGNEVKNAFVSFLTKLIPLVTTLVGSLLGALISGASSQGDVALTQSGAMLGAVVATSLTKIS